MVVSDIRYQYYRDRHGAPRVTLCRIRTEDGRYGYGWSICTDGIVRYVDEVLLVRPSTPSGAYTLTRMRGGRSIARGRAEAALKNRGIQCQPFTDASCWIFHRPICRPEAVAVLEECQATALLRCLATRNMKWLRQAMQPDAVGQNHTYVNPHAAGAAHYRPITQDKYFPGGSIIADEISPRLLSIEEVAQLYDRARRAGVDAIELERLERLEAQQATDAAGYLQTPTVYSEVLERFVPDNEAL